MGDAAAGVHGLPRRGEVRAESPGGRAGLRGCSGRGPLKVTCYTFPEHADRAGAFLKEAAAIVHYYERKYRPYPYEKLAVVEIPLFPGGYGPRPS